MPAISYSDFSGGLDRRLSVNSQDANKLWILRNAYVTLAKRIKKRPCLQGFTGNLTGSFGLKSIDAVLKVFVETGSTFVPPVYAGLAMTLITLDNPFAGASALDRVYSADIFQGNLYVVARYANGLTRHHYVDSISSTVTITNAAPGVVTWTAHGLAAGRQVMFSTTGTLPSPLVANTAYYVKNPAANTFELALTSGGASITTTTAGSGVHTARIPTYIDDVNCPHSLGVTRAASRIFAPSGTNVRYCAAGAARDWTTASDAGFLAAGLQQDTRGNVTACGTFQESLVVLFEDSSQIWNVATDPSGNALTKSLNGVGTNQPLTVASFASDLVFLSRYGFRSMTVQAISSRIDDNDVGVPVDSLVVADLAVYNALADPRKITGHWISELGQYWAVMDMGTYSKAWVYSFSRSSKVACWSEYVFSIRILDITTLNGSVYLRSLDKLYQVQPDGVADDGAEIQVEVQMAFQDAKQPGVAKQVWGADIVSTGAWELSFKYDPRDTSKETTPMSMQGDSRPGDIIPVEIVAPAFAPVFTHSANEAASIDALTLFFHSLGAV